MREQTDRRPRTRTEPAPAQMPETEEAVEAHWPPLTPEHGFPSQLFQGSGRSPSARSRPLRRLAATKNRRHHSGASCKKSFSYDFLRRHYPHQVQRLSKDSLQGSKFENFLSACVYKLPCICLSGVFYTHRGENARVFFFRRLFCGILRESPRAEQRAEKGDMAYGSCQSGIGCSIRSDGRPVEGIFLL